MFSLQRFTGLSSSRFFAGKMAALAVFAALCSLNAVSCKDAFGGYEFAVVPKAVSLPLGMTYKLEAEWPPDGTAAISWSSNSGSVTVDSEGNVTGVDLGEALITVKALNGGGGELASSQCKVTVIDESLFNKFIITPRNFQLANGTSYKIETVSVPEGTVAISWSSDSASATVDADGLVTGNGLGFAIITAKALNESGGETGSEQCIVIISDETVIPIDFRVFPSSCLLAPGESKRLSAYGAPEGTTVEWSSSGSGTATVNSSGLVTAIRTGYSMVTATLKNESLETVASDFCVVMVTAGPAGAFAVVPTTLSLTEGGTTSLSTTNNPSGTTSISWSSNSASASVDAFGVVTAVGAGQATITATAKAGGVTLAMATCVVTITSAAPGPSGPFAVVPATLSLTEGEAVSLTTANNPSGTTTISWSSDSASASVDASGAVTAVGAGQATITATAKAGGLTLAMATCAVTITSAPPGPGQFAVVPATLSLTEGETASLTTANNPSGTTGIIWSSDSASASVDVSGALTALGAGQVTVTATAKAGSTTLATAACVITIAPLILQPDANTLATLVRGGAIPGITYYKTPDYNLENVIMSAVASASSGTEEKPDRILLMAGKTYPVPAAVRTDGKNLQISTYSAGQATIKRLNNYTTDYTIDHRNSGTLILGGGDGTKKLVINGDLEDSPISISRSIIYVTSTLIIKDGAEIVGNSDRGVFVPGTGILRMEGGAIKNNHNGGVDVSTAAGTFLMTGGVISENSSSTLSAGGGATINSSIFLKTGGTIYGSDGGANANTASRGSAVYDVSAGKQRNTTAGPMDNLDSSDTTGWE